MSDHIQQTLPALEPIYTARNVLPYFFGIGVAFVSIGIGLMHVNNQVKEVIVDYTDCNNLAAETCSSVIQQFDEFGKPLPCQCTLDLEVGATDWEGQVFLYYGLTNFYQNHRLYVRSRDDKQLYGDLKSRNENCKPLWKKNETHYYAPCGAIANSMFNDSITLQYTKAGEVDNWQPVPVLKRGIAWESDRKYKFKNPDTGGDTSPAALKRAFERENTVKPSDWQKNVWELDLEDSENNGFLNEDFIVWMRTAAMPNFRKLYRMLDGEFKSGLAVNNKYRLVIDYNYKVVQFNGTKSIILSTTSILGAKNPFFGIAFIVIGCIFFIVAVIFVFIHLRFGRNISNI